MNRDNHPHRSSNNVLTPGFVLRKRAQWVVAAMVAGSAAGAGLGAYIAAVSLLSFGQRHGDCERVGWVAESRDDDRVRIDSRLAGNVSIRPKESQPQPADRQLLVVHDGGLWALMPDPWNQTGEVKRLAATEEGVVALAAPAVSELPTASTLAVGDVLHLYEQGQISCRARVTGFFALGRHHDGEVGDVNEVERWSMSEATFAASLEPMNGIGTHCETASWASSNPVPNSELATSVSIKKGEKEFLVARKKFRQLPAYKTVQNGFVSDGGTGAWDNAGNPWDEDNFLVFSVQGESSLVLVSARSGGCGEPGGELFAVWRIENDGAWSLLYSEKQSVTELEAARSGAEHAPQLILSHDFNYRVLRSLDGKIRDEDSTRESDGVVDFVPYFGCRC